MRAIAGDNQRWIGIHRWPRRGLMPAPRHRQPFDVRSVLGPAAAVLVTAAVGVPLLLGYVNPPHRGTVVQLPGICSDCFPTSTAPSEPPSTVPVPTERPAAPPLSSRPKSAATSRPPRRPIPAPAVPPPVVKTTPTPTRTVCPMRPPKPSRTR